MLTDILKVLIDGNYQPGEILEIRGVFIELLADFKILLKTGAGWVCLDLRPLLLRLGLQTIRPLS